MPKDSDRLVSARAIAVDTTFILIATGEYYDYARTLISDIEKFFVAEPVQILIFTDVTTDLKSSPIHLVHHVQINSEPWPEVTLFRFNKIIQFSDKILGKYVVWTDADMRIRRHFDPKNLLSNDLIKLSRHPGFSLNPTHLIKSTIRRPSQVLSLLKRWTIIKSHRTSKEGWETNPYSAGYVPYSERKIYVQGGFWIARKESALRMCETIERRILNDLELGYIPTYHDETFLNWYMATYKPNLLPRDFVGVEGYCWQALEKSHVFCVDKKAL
jgi:hypothetical protein